MYQVTEEISLDLLSEVKTRSIKAFKELGLLSEGVDAKEIMDLCLNENEEMIKLSQAIFQIDDKTLKKLKATQDDINVTAVIKGYKDFFQKLV